MTVTIEPEAPRVRCSWCGDDELYVAYHDTEWGVPVHDDRMLFELLTLEGAQAGLSWLTVLRRREGYRRLFEGFDPALVAGFDADDRARILADPGVVRHRQKIESVVGNAQAILELQERYGSFASYVWELGRVADPTSLDEANTVARAMSKTLRKEGFGFVGPTICFSFMEAAGMVNHHARECFRLAELAGPAGPPIL